MKIAFIVAHTRNNLVVLFATLKLESFMLTEVRDCDLLIVVTYQEITRVILCRLILNDIILHMKFLNDIFMFQKL